MPQALAKRMPKKIVSTFTEKPKTETKPKIKAVDETPKPKLEAVKEEVKVEKTQTVQETVKPTVARPKSRNFKAEREARAKEQAARQKRNAQESTERRQDNRYQQKK